MNTNTSSVYSYINNSINYYKWIMIKLSPELKDYIISYCDPINEAIDYFIRLGPSTLYQNRLKGLPVYQNPTILSVPGFINNKGWHEIPYYIKDTLTQELLDIITNEYITLSRIDNDKQSNHWTENISLPNSNSSSNSNKINQWKVHHIMEEGNWNAIPCESCPYLYQWLQTLPICDCSFGYIYFSILSKGSTIRPHYGSSNAKIRIQIPLIIPDSNDINNCSLTVCQETRMYEKNLSSVMVFDDSYLHMVDNQTDQDRVVLLIDLWNPELSSKSIAKIKDHFRCQSRQAFTDGHWNYPIIATPDTKEKKGSALDEQPEYDYLFKFLSIGDPGTGKSYLTLRASNSEVSLSGFISTIGVDFKIFNEMIRNVQVKIQMWDVAGPERFKTITSSYYRDANVIFILFDTTDDETFQNVDFWINETNKYTTDTTLKVLVGTKIDLITKRQITYKQACIYAKSKQLPYFEISSVTGENVSRLIKYAIKRKLSTVNTNTKPTTSKRSTMFSSSSKFFRCTIC